MKRVDLIRHLEAHGCAFVREGGEHTVYRQTGSGLQSTLPRHREIKEGLVRRICRRSACRSRRTQRRSVIVAALAEDAGTQHVEPSRSDPGQALAA